MQMRNHVSEQFHIHVIGPSNFHECIVRNAQIARIGLPFPRCELIETHRVPRVEYQQTVTTVGLICGEVERRYRERSDEVPMLVAARTGCIEWAVVDGHAPQRMVYSLSGQY